MVLNRLLTGMILQVIDLRCPKVEPTPSCNTKDTSMSTCEVGISRLPICNFRWLLSEWHSRGQEREERWRFACPWSTNYRCDDFTCQTNTDLWQRIQATNIYEHIYEQTASLIEHLMRISCLKGALAPQHSKATAHRKTLEYTEESRWHNTSESNIRTWK